ncbi:MAG: DEAD/DEAH box helicase, partial [Acidihalobacter sp.]
MELNVTDTLAEAAQAAGFSKPTALQERLLPVIRSGADVLLQAPGGGARSLAYLLPMMQRLLERDPLEGRGPRSLILSPSRDAAMKVGRTIKDIGRDSPLRFGTVVGGRPYPMQHQLLRRPLDILVATPSRLMDHIRRGRVPFERLEMLVIDRVDEMLELGLKDDLEFIASTSPEQRQTVLLGE